jgi:hypothetical protein
LAGSFEQARLGGGGALSDPQPDEPAAARSGGSLPSLLRSAPALVLFAIVIADAMRAADTDLWGHIFFGRIVLSHHQLWFHAPFSYAVAPGPRKWIMHDWLGNALMAVVYDGAGVLGLKLAKFACVAALMVLLSLGAAETGASLEAQAIVFLVGALALLPMMQLRTYLADDLLLAALILMLGREAYGSTQRGHAPWLAIPMFALWANLHGGFFIGLIALGLYAAIRGAQDLAAARSASTAARLVAISAAAALATLVNPYGLRDWLVIAGVLRNPFTLAHISEFRPLFVVIADLYRHGRPLFPFACAVLIMAAVLVSFALTPRADDLALFAIAALMSAAALYAVRNTALAVVAAVVPLCRHAGLLVGGRGAWNREDAPHSLPWPRMQIAVAGAAALIALRTGLLSSRLPAVEEKPVGAVAFMRAHNVHGNVLCEFGWADYLLWHDAPRSRVFIESLFEAYYPPEVQRDYAAFYYARPGATRALDAYPTQFVLMPSGSPADAVMRAQGGWRLLYRDPVAALFARADSPAARLAGVAEINASAPPSFFP